MHSKCGASLEPLSDPTESLSHNVKPGRAKKTLKIALSGAFTGRNAKGSGWHGVSIQYFLS